jgi:transcriptional regulator with XRE-family HTH domain
MKPSELDDFLRLNKMTGSELAAKLGVHYVTISRWRNGREPIPKTVELAMKWLEGEGRIDAIGQNDNERGEHYQ